MKTKTKSAAVPDERAAPVFGQNVNNNKQKMKTKTTTKITAGVHERAVERVGQISEGIGNLISGKLGVIWIIGLLLMVGIGTVSACDHYCNSCYDCEAKINAANAGETICLNQDIINHIGTCINNPANFNNKIFDCQGHKIDGDDSGTDNGIYINAKEDNTIRNCHISGFSIAVKLESSSYNNISDNLFDSNYCVNSVSGGTCYAGGVYLISSSTYNTISKNNMTSNRCDNRKGSGFSGCFANAVHLSDYSDYNFIFKNNIRQTNCTVTGGSWGFCSSDGISLDHSNNNTISANSYIDNDGYGGIVSSDGVNANVIGISLGHSSDNNLISNDISSNTCSKSGAGTCYSVGIFIFNSSSNNASENNIFSNTCKNVYGSRKCENAGIYLYDYSIGNTASNNDINLNKYYGIWINYNANLNDIFNNKISNNFYGIYSQASTSTINSNYVCGNTNLDFDSSDWLSSSGDDNTCDNANGWNDEGTTGCTYSCFARTTECISGETKPCTAPNTCQGTKTCINEKWNDCTTNLKKCNDSTCKTTCVCEYEGQTRSCTASNECTGSQTCNNEQWSDCETNLQKCDDGSCIPKTETCTCKEGETNTCMANGCAGSKTCTNGQWSECSAKYLKKCAVDGSCIPQTETCPDNISTPPHFSSKAMSADDRNPGRLAVQITNIMGNPAIEAQIIIDVPDDVEVSGSVGAMEGKASYNAVKLNVPDGGVTYVEIPFTAKESGDYRVSATMYWKWQGTDELHQIGFDHTITINKIGGEVCIQKPGGDTCPGLPPEPGSEFPTPTHLLLITIVFLGLAVIIAVWKKPKFIFRHKE